MRRVMKVLSGVATVVIVAGVFYLIGVPSEMDLDTALGVYRPMSEYLVSAAYAVVMIGVGFLGRAVAKYYENILC